MSITQPTPPDGWNAFQAKKGQAPPPDDNQPDECRNLTSEERQIFDNARAAVDVIKKTFETWMVIARGVEAARKRADTFKDRKKSFERILEAQGLSAVLGKTPSSVHSTSVRLLKIL